MSYFIVYQQIVTQTRKVKGMHLDTEVKMLVRKVEAENRHKAIKAFEQDTEKIQKIRGSKIGCVDFDTARTIKYKRRRKTTK